MLHDPVTLIAALRLLPRRCAWRLQANRFTRLCCAFRAIEAMAWQNDFYTSTLVILIGFRLDSIQIEFLEYVEMSFIFPLSTVLN